MRIAFVTPEYVTESNFDGGLANYLGRVCPTLARQGHDVVVFVRADCDEVVDADGVEVRRVTVKPLLGGWLNSGACQQLQTASLWLGQSWALYKACAKVNRARSFDLIQYASYTGTGFFRLRKVPSVVRISSYEPILQDAYGYPETWENRSRIWIERKALRRADAVFGPSRLVASLVERDIGRPVAVIESPFLLGPGQMDDRLFRENLAGKKYLLFFGSLSKLKGVHLIAEIIGELLSEHPEINFVFAGKCFSFNGRPIIEHVRECAGTEKERVVYLGPLQHNQLYPVVANAYAVVLPSLIDNLPNTCIEAMAFKRVVVASRGASFEQLIDPGVSGFLCNNGSSSSLYSEIRQVLSLPADRYASVGISAGRRIDELKPERTVRELLAFYRHVRGAD